MTPPRPGNRPRSPRRRPWPAAALAAILVFSHSAPRIVVPANAQPAGPFAIPAANPAGNPAGNPAANPVRIQVLSLFRPRQLRLGAVQGVPLTLALDGRTRRLDPREPALVRLAAGQLEVQLAAEDRPIPASLLRASTDLLGPASGPASGAYPGSASGSAPGPAPGPAQFWLEVPGKLHRGYAGAVEIRAVPGPRGPVLQAIVTMPLETAVASIVAAESPPRAPLAALEAQAVAARSFLVARRSGHIGFDFCDTTHCQFLRSPPPAGSLPERAARATAGLVLTWRDNAQARDRVLAAMYARSCGGRTRTLREIGLPASGYPYYSVRCAYCSRHPELWRRPAAGAALTESQRLAFNRIHGWAALPSLPQSAASAAGASGSLIEGRGVGHGIGLCQLGAAEMARQGAGFAQILAHYYPNTTLAPMP